MNFVKISDVIPKVMAKKEMAKTVQDEEVLFFYNEKISAKLGAKAKQIIKVKALKNRVIYVAVKDGGWAQKVQLMNGEIQREVDRRYPNKVKSIRIKVERITD